MTLWGDSWWMRAISTDVCFDFSFSFVGRRKLTFSFHVFSLTVVVSQYFGELKNLCTEDICYVRKP